jgi:hypothetical protein
MPFFEIVDYLLALFFIKQYGHITRVRENNGLVVIWIFWVLVFVSCIYTLLFVSFDFLSFFFFFCPDFFFVFSWDLFL